MLLLKRWPFTTISPWRPFKTTLTALPLSAFKKSELARGGKILGVTSVRALNIFALGLKKGSQVNARIHYRGGPQMFARVIPLA
jgi:hypothetical protein